MRTGDIYSPWPEEANRKLTGALTKYHFAPTETSRQNLLAEGYAGATISVTGNTVIDALLQVVSKIESDLSLQEELKKYYPFMDENKDLVVVTGHRRESFGQRFREYLFVHR